MVALCLFVVDLSAWRYFIIFLWTFSVLLSSFCINFVPVCAFVVVLHCILLCGPFASVGEFLLLFGHFLLSVFLCLFVDVLHSLLVI